VISIAKVAGLRLIGYLVLFYFLTYTFLILDVYCFDFRVDYFSANL
jgi:hypothetical protein